MTVKILLDMDGVLANFVQGACDFLKVHNPYINPAPEARGSWDLLANLGMNQEEQDKFWNDINCEGFWNCLPLMEEAKYIVNELECAVGRNNICLLSSPGHMPHSMVGKVVWIKRNFPQYQRRFLFGSQKEFCAGTLDHVLIDDYEKNVSTFRRNGGRAFLVPRPWNKDHDEEHNLVSTLSRFLDTL